MRFDLARLAALGRHDEYVDRIRREVGVLGDVGGVGDVSAVGRPARLALGVYGAVGELRGPARAGVHSPDVPLFFRKEADAVPLVVDARIVPGHDAEAALALVGLSIQVLLVPLLELERQAGAVRRPLERSELALEPGQRTRLASAEWYYVDLRLGGIAPVGEKRYLSEPSGDQRGRVSCWSP